MKVVLIYFLLLIGLSLRLCAAQAENAPADQEVRSSPKQPWGEFTVVEEKKGTPWWAHVLLWFPNRVMDFVDIFHVDFGAGPSVGGVIRVSQYAQAGYRHMTPLSVRVGLAGRQRPFFVERSDEYGIGPRFHKSKDRKVCPGEVGAGVDLLIVGAYGGICMEEVFDFIAGLFFLDVSGDDLK
jgi:hypothetical protein